MPIDTLRLDHSFTEQLPADPITDNHRRQVNRACYSFVKPRPFTQARLLAYSREMAASLGLSETDCQSKAFLELFSGTTLLPDMRPYAQCYGGHQFGNWAGQLGDGRAINLGEVVNDAGEHWVLQLKGAGPTPYSRTADGLAVLRSSVREYLCSEAMFHLGVPTTRALSLIATGEEVMRDMFYDGNPQMEPGAVVCRVSPSFLRFGSYQIFAARQENDVLKQLVDYTIEHDFPDLGKASVDTYLAWFEEVTRRTCALMVEWMRVGFVHGVMNTDNMSILGLTIDYGPYGWLEDYDPGWTPNTTDAGGRRYRFGQQPQIGLWNLVQLANAIYPLINDAAPLERILENYTQAYEKQYLQMMAGKLGLQSFNAEEDEKLIRELTRILPLTETDMTIFFRQLAGIDPQILSATTTADELIAPISAAFYGEATPGRVPENVAEKVQEEFARWLAAYAERLKANTWSQEEKRQQMNSVNPLYVLRNYLAQLAIDKAAEGGLSGIEELQDVLKNPYTEQSGKQHLAAKRPEWARHRAGCSMLSCSS